MKLLGMIVIINQLVSLKQL